MSTTEKFAAAREALRSKLHPVLPPPPAPADAPENLKASDPVTGESIDAVMATVDDKARLNEAAKGDLPAANDDDGKTSAPRARGRSKPAKKTPKSEGGRTLDGYKQLSGRVPKDVHLRVVMAAKVHDRDIGDILAEAFTLWEKKNPNR